jgi:hypothetical protein
MLNLYYSTKNFGCNKNSAKFLFNESSTNKIYFESLVNYTQIKSNLFSFMEEKSTTEKYSLKGRLSNQVEEALKQKLIK